MSSERRRAPRVEVLGRIRGEIMSTDTPVTMREVSLGGLSFASPAPFPIGTVYEFNLTPGDGSLVLLRGRVARSELRPGAEGEAGFYVTGVQFLDEEPTPAEAAPIGSLIDKIK